MRLITDALIIRENNNIGESDRFVTALTKELGAVHASARGAQTLKGRGSAATRLLSYSRLTLREGRSRDKYIIEDARPLRVFSTSTGTSPACLWPSISANSRACSPPGRNLLRSTCVCCSTPCIFWPRTGGISGRSRRLWSCRMLTLSDYMPDRRAAQFAGRIPGDPLWFLPRDGVLRCGKCERLVMPNPSAPRFWPRCGTSCMPHLKNASRSRFLQKPFPSWPKRPRLSCSVS